MGTRSDRIFWTIAAVCLLGLGWLAFGETNDVVNVKNEWGRTWARVRIWNKGEVVSCVDLKLPLGTTLAQIKARATAVQGAYLRDKTNPPPVIVTFTATEVKGMLDQAQAGFTNALGAAYTKAVSAAWTNTVQAAFEPATAKAIVTGTAQQIEP